MTANCGLSCLAQVFDLVKVHIDPASAMGVDFHRRTLIDVPVDIIFKDKVGQIADFKYVQWQ